MEDKKAVICLLKKWRLITGQIKNLEIEIDSLKNLIQILSDVPTSAASVAAYRQGVKDTAAFLSRLRATLAAIDYAVNSLDERAAAIIRGRYFSFMAWREISASSGLSARRCQEIAARAVVDVAAVLSRKGKFIKVNHSGAENGRLKKGGAAL